MLNLNVYNRQGESVGTVEIDPDEFGGSVSRQLLHDVVVMHLANQRAGTHSTLRRGEASTRSLGSFSAMPSRRSRRCISTQTSLG